MFLFDSLQWEMKGGRDDKEGSDSHTYGLLHIIKLNLTTGSFSCEHDTEAAEECGYRLKAGVKVRVSCVLEGGQIA